MRIIEGRDPAYEKRLTKMLRAGNMGLIPHDLIFRIRCDYFSRGIVYGDDHAAMKALPETHTEADMNKNAYDPKNVVVTINGQPINGFAEADIVSVNTLSSYHLIGRMCLYKARCESANPVCRPEPEPGRSSITNVTFGYTLADVLVQIAPPEDWEWWKRFFTELGVFKP